jgi:REP element-mobilizing transposase RayT
MDRIQSRSPSSAAVPAAGSGGVSPPVPEARTETMRGPSGETPALRGSGASGHLVAGVHSRGTLPHLKREGGTYFVTFRQAGTLPRDVLLQLKQERETIVRLALAANRPLSWAEQEDLFRWYSDRVDRYLDHGCGDDCLRHPECADLVAGALRFFHGKRYELVAWVVMPNHVHVVVRPTPPHSLSGILHSWKSFTAHRINQLLPERRVPLWQTESYDHLIRDDDDLHRCSNYTLMNPVNAGLCAEAHLWPWSSAHAAFRALEVGLESETGGQGGDGGETPPEPAGETPALREQLISND